MSVGGLGGAGQAPLPGYVVRNNTLVSASFAGLPGQVYGVYDQIARPDELATMLRSAATERKAAEARAGMAQPA